MRTLTLHLALCFAFPATVAKSADISAKTTLTESVDANSNYFLGPDPRGVTYLSSSTLSLDVLARTPTTLYDFKSAFSYFNYFGPGAVDAPLVGSTTNSATLNVEHKVDRIADQVYFTGGWSRADVAQTRVTETGTSGGRGEIDVYMMEAGLKGQLTNTDSFRLSVRGANADFSAGAPPFFDAVTTGVFTHRLDLISDLISTVRYEWQDFEGTTPIQNNFWQATTGLHTMLTKRLSFFATVGAAVTDVSQKNIDQFLNTSPPAPIASGPAAGLMWNTGVTYKMASTDISLSSTQDQGPNTLGTLQKSTTIDLTAHHFVDHSSSLTLSGNFSHTTLANLTFDLYSARATYNYQLSREWRTGLSYEFRQRTGDAVSLGSASSNGVKLTFSRDATILP